MYLACKFQDHSEVKLVRMFLLKWITFLDWAVILQNIMWGRRFRVCAQHTSPTWNKCVTYFYSNYGMNFNQSMRIAVWDLQHLFEMKFKAMIHSLWVKMYDEYRNWSTFSYRIPRIPLCKLYQRFALKCIYIYIHRHTRIHTY